MTATHLQTDHQTYSTILMDMNVIQPDYFWAARRIPVAFSPGPACISNNISIFTFKLNYISKDGPQK